MKKFIIIIAGFLILISLISCNSDIVKTNTKLDDEFMKTKYNAVMYGNPYTVKTWMKDDFFENNLTHGSWSYVQEKHVQGDKYPPYKNIIINNLDEFNETFAEFPVEVNFEKDMILMFGRTKSSSSELIIKDVVIDDQTLYVKYRCSVTETPNASMPLTKWIVVKMDKLNVTSVVFLENTK